MWLFLLCELCNNKRAALFKSAGLFPPFTINNPGAEKPLLICGCYSTAAHVVVRILPVQVSRLCSWQIKHLVLSSFDIWCCFYSGIMTLGRFGANQQLTFSASPTFFSDAKMSWWNYFNLLYPSWLGCWWMYMCWCVLQTAQWSNMASRLWSNPVHMSKSSSSNLLSNQRSRLSLSLTDEMSVFHSSRVVASAAGSIIVASLNRQLWLLCSAPPPPLEGVRKKPQKCIGFFWKFIFDVAWMLWGGEALALVWWIWRFIFRWVCRSWMFYQMIFVVFLSLWHLRLKTVVDSVLSFHHRWYCFILLSAGRTFRWLRRVSGRKHWSHSMFVWRMIKVSIWHFSYQQTSLLRWYKSFRTNEREFNCKSHLLFDTRDAS